MHEPRAATLTPFFQNTQREHILFQPRQLRIHAWKGDIDMRHAACCYLYTCGRMGKTWPSSNKSSAIERLLHVRIQPYLRELDPCIQRDPNLSTRSGICRSGVPFPHNFIFLVLLNLLDFMDSIRLSVQHSNHREGKRKGLSVEILFLILFALSLIHVSTHETD